MHTEHLRTVCLPIGFSGTANQPLASALTAHPNMVMGNQLDLLENWWNQGNPMTADAFFSEILEINRKMLLDEISYTRKNKCYSVTGQWQGRFERLTVIGDCSPDTNAKMLAKKDCEALEIFAERAKLPLKFIFLVRNPYDMISSKTISAYWNEPRTEILETLIRKFVRNCEIRESLLAKISRMPEQQVLIWRLEEHIEDPKQKLAEICTFLNVESTPSYLDACARIFYKKPSESRYLIEWPNQYKEKIAAAIKQYDFLSNYSWDL